MGWLAESLNSSIGKKFIMAVTGLSLISFLLIHLIGNFTLYGGPEAFNGYVETLEIVKPVIRVIELVLALIFILHIFNGIKLWYENKKARPDTYAVDSKKENTTFSSRTMIISGSIVFIFLVLHLATFWVAFNFSGDTHEKAMVYYSVVLEWFQEGWYAGFYVIAVLLLGFHLNHGFQSAFQTFGWNHKKYFPFIKKLGTIYAILMAVGFASIPIYFFINGGN
ncbi:MAG: succinate dehydrogenase [Ignavibacteriae bacterium HGW-Ignavibacteriae-2]|jgi:succinate dehydrogenase / fumarate reductase cytochrome b subunit|nr:MAG: succinate dehydrogenase [Ignavibacteriae bacterium HGW-Ignavibacteriae-2]